MNEYYESQYKELINRYLDSVIYEDEEILFFLKENKFQYISPSTKLSSPFYKDFKMSGTGLFDFTKYDVFDMYDLTFIQYISSYDFATNEFKNFVNDKLNFLDDEFDDEDGEKQTEYRVFFNKQLFNRLKQIQLKLNKNKEY